MPKFSMDCAIAYAADVIEGLADITVQKTLPIQGP